MVPCYTAYDMSEKKPHHSIDPTRKATWKEETREITVFGRKVTVSYPKLTDPRIVQITILTTVTLLGQLVFYFRINPLQILTVLITSVLLDIALTYRQTGMIVFPASGFISGLSLALLLEVDRGRPYQYWAYFIAGILAIGSKHIIVYKKRHIFNPSNFAIVLLLVAIPQIVTINPEQWRTSFLLIAPILLLGTRLIIKAKVYAIALSFMAAEVFFFAVYHLNGELNWFQGVTNFPFSFFSPSLLIFTFFMITDPRTVPKNQLGKVLFGGIIGALHWFYLSFGFESLALFLGLFTMSMTVPLINKITESWE